MSVCIHAPGWKRFKMFPWSFIRAFRTWIFILTTFNLVSDEKIFPLYCKLSAEIKFVQFSNKLNRFLFTFSHFSSFSFMIKTAPQFWQQISKLFVLIPSFHILPWNKLWNEHYAFHYHSASVFKVFIGEIVF